MSAEKRIAELERTVAQQGEDIAFLARHTPLHEKGAATPAEYAQAREIADRVPRGGISLTHPENATP